MKGRGATRNLREGKFGVVWDKLKAKECFENQSLTKYLRLTIVFMWKSALWEKFNFSFSRLLCKY